MAANLMQCGLCFVAGILLNMSLAHLANFAETTRHRSIARTRRPKLASTLWGLLQLALGGLILMLVRYQFELNLSTLFLFAGFSAWAVFLGMLADRLDKRQRL